MGLLRRWLIGLAIALSVLGSGTQAQPTADELAEAEAFALGYQAYITGAVYARSQILMEYDINPNAPLNAPLNVFNIYPELATPDTAIDFAPNNDTVYGLAWLDLRHGPVLMTIPATPDRYWVVQATDWALNTLDYVGSRVESKPGTYAYVPPGWTGSLPEGVTRIESSTTGVFLQARVVVTPDSKADLNRVLAMLKTFRLEPLDPVATYLTVAPGAPLVRTQMDNPLWQNLDFYPLLNRAWTFGGVREQDAEVARLALALGIGPGLNFDPAKLSAAQLRGLERAAKTGFERIWQHALTFGERRNGWRFASNLGFYGNNRLLASTIGMRGYGANTAVEAMYLPAYVDGSGQPLNGGNSYRIRFPAGQIPPASAFWSVTMYTLPNNRLVANPINRYAISDRTPGVKFERDGSLILRIQHDRPRGADARNWLPSPAGRFWVILRMYGPKPEVLRGEYAPPPVERVEKRPANPATELAQSCTGYAMSDGGLARLRGE